MYTCGSANEERWPILQDCRDNRANREDFPILIGRWKFSKLCCKLNVNKKFARLAQQLGTLAQTHNLRYLQTRQKPVGAFLATLLR